MSMYFLDETDDWPEYRTIREEIQRLDREHLELRRELQEAQSRLKADPANEDLKSHMDLLENKLKAIEKKLDESLSMYR